MDQVFFDHEVPPVTELLLFIPAALGLRLRPVGVILGVHFVWLEYAEGALPKFIPTNCFLLQDTD